MKVKVPHSVQIGPRIFQIEYKTKVLDKDKEELSGACHPSYDHMEISLTSNKHKAMLFSTIFHEFCHGMLYVGGQSSRLADEGNQEEDLVIVLESYLESMINWKSPIWTKWKLVELIPKEES